MRRYIVQKITRGFFKPLWSLTVIRPEDDPEGLAVIRLGTYGTRKAAVTTARLLAGHGDAVQVAALPARL